MIAIGLKPIHCKNNNQKILIAIASKCEQNEDLYLKHFKDKCLLLAHTVRRLTNGKSSQQVGPLK